MLELNDNQNSAAAAPRRNLQQRGQPQSTTFRSSASDSANSGNAEAAPAGDGFFNGGFFCCLTTKWLQAAERTAPQLCAALLCFRAPLDLYCIPCYSRRLVVLEEDEVGIVERFNKFQRVVAPGPMLLEQPLGIAVESLRRRVSLRTRRVVVNCESKTKDSVFCKLEILVSYRLRGQEAFLAARKQMSGTDSGSSAMAAAAAGISSSTAAAAAVESQPTGEVELAPVAGSAATSSSSNSLSYRHDRPVDYNAALLEVTEAAKEATYKIEDFEGLITTVTNDVVRGFLATMLLDRAFLASEEVVSAVQARLNRDDILEFGYECSAVLLVRFAPAQKVADEMNNIYTQALKRQSQEQVALARKEVQYILSSGEAERKHLQGQGVSLMRSAYLQGMQECLDNFADSFQGSKVGEYVLSWSDVLYMQLLLQYFDTQRGIRYDSGSGRKSHKNGTTHQGILALNLGPEAVYAMRERLSVGHVRAEGETLPKPSKKNAPSKSNKKKSPPSRPKVKAGTAGKESQPKASPGTKSKDSLRLRGAASRSSASSTESAASSAAGSSLDGLVEETATKAGIKRPSKAGTTASRKSAPPPRPSSGKHPPPARRSPTKETRGSSSGSRESSRESVTSRNSAGSV
jgi:regulator of protease activity HflC (stomatin/prohibitin superfamily)